MLNKNLLRRSLVEKPLLKKISVAIVVAGALIGAYRSRRLIKDKLQTVIEKARNKNNGVGIPAKA